MERNLKESAGIPLRRTRVERKRVKKVKLAIKPTTTPRGLRFPELSTEEDKITGSIGKMHGERMVTIPAKKANASSKIMRYLILNNNSSICPPFHLVTSSPF